MELSSQKKISLSNKQQQDLIAQSMFEINNLVNSINTYTLIINDEKFNKNNIFR